VISVVILDANNNKIIVKSISEEKLKKEFNDNIEEFAIETAGSSNIQWMVINNETELLVSKNFFLIERGNRWIDIVWL